MTRQSLPFIAVLMCLCSSIASAESSSGRLFINPSWSFLLFDGDRRPEDAKGLGVGLEYRFVSGWAAELAAFKSDARVETYQSDYEVGYTQYKVDGLYYFRQGKMLEPFVAFGAGRAELDFKGAETETQYNAGVGVRVHFNQWLSLRWDVRALPSADNSNLESMTTFGLSFAFGGDSAPNHSYSPEDQPQRIFSNVDAPNDYDGDGVTDRYDRCPQTSAGVLVDANGCTLDSDNDGVRDDADQCPDTPANTTVGASGCSLDSDGDGVSDEFDQCPGSRSNAIVDIYGCVGVTKIVAVEKIQLNINFSSNSDKIDPKYFVELERVAGFLAAYSNINVLIEGHSDSIGRADYNKRLSQQRADAVRNALIREFAVSPDRVSAVGYGEERPIADDSTAAGQRLNRRVVAVITKEILK